MTFTSCHRYYSHCYHLTKRQKIDANQHIHSDRGDGGDDRYHFKT